MHYLKPIFAKVVTYKNYFLNIKRLTFLDSFKYRIKFYFMWKRIPTIAIQDKLDISIYACSNLLIEDIDLDGKDEIIILQSAGIFKGKNFNYAINSKNHIQKKIFYLVCIDKQGLVRWAYGDKWKEEFPYITHGQEEIIKLADVNQDGYKEIITLDDDNLLIIDHNGKLLNEIKLPTDNFSIIYHIPINNHDFIIVLGTMDRGYAPHSYGNPWIIMNKNFEIISMKDYLGAGHNIIIEDINKDGNIELLIGYQLVDLKGEVIWTIDYWKNRKMNSLEQHVDCVQSFWEDGQWYATISGSDKQYLINAQGETLWVKNLPHPQYCLVGKYKDEMRIFIVNQRELMNSYNLKGAEKWSGVLPEYWASSSKPKLTDPIRPIHQTKPMGKLKYNNKDYIVYLEGGYPYIINFNGQIKFRLAHTNEAKLFVGSDLFKRINDIGVSFQFLNKDDQFLYLYSRNDLFIYSIN
jgi:hypothetical protein